jgi:hypothetical protein
MFLVDTEKGRIVEDEEIKDEICRGKPYGKWLRENKISLADIDVSPPTATGREYASLVQRQKTFGYTQEDLSFLMGPMANAGDEPRGSMGTDTPLAVLSDRPQLLFNYFKQHFAQVLQMGTVDHAGQRLAGGERGDHENGEFRHQVEWLFADPACGRPRVRHRRRSWRPDGRLRLDH